MDRKTEELRDIFMDVADDDTVTESQEESRGSLTDRPDVEDRLAAVVGELRERYDLDTALEDPVLVDLVRCVYDGRDDAEIATAITDSVADAESLELDEDSVFAARMDLHLVRDDDLPAEDSAMDALRDARDDGAAAVADALDVDEATAERYVRALDAREQSRAANDRYRAAFEDVLTDADLMTNLDSAREDGLDEATEGMEVDVDF